MKASDEYLEIIIKINPVAAEFASDVLFSNFECDGVVISTENYRDLELVSRENNVIKGFIRKENIDLQCINDIIKNEYNRLLSNGCTKEQLGEWSVTVNKVENQDWSKKWKENWRPTSITKSITICPSWIEYTARKDELVINIDPGAAFGTGTHETTKLCVFAMEEYLKKDMNVADIGTGTGILAIIASKMGAKSVYAVDNDAIAIEAACKNAELNNIKNCIFKVCESRDILAKFDFICANILHNVLIEIMGDLKNILADGGKIVLSGILNTKADMVKESVIKNGLDILKTDNLNQWTSIIVEKQR